MDRPDSSSISRRTLAAAVVAGTGFFAGCLDGESGDGGDPGDGSESGNGENDGGDLELVDHPGDEPMDAPDGYNCPVCNMQPNDWTDWNAQLVHDGDEATFFDSAGCLFNYYADPETYGGPDSEITGAWATDFDTRELIDATEASFVLEDDHDRNADPMDSPVPFADREDAVAYVEEYDNLSEDDIVGLEDADSEEATIY